MVRAFSGFRASGRLPRSPVFHLHLAALLVAVPIAVNVRAQGPPPADVAVTIYATRADGRGQGSGFFTTGQGRILTAYHVVEGAREIEVIHDSLGPFKRILVDSISPERDLAVLQILDPLTTTPFLPLIQTYVPDPADDFVVVGYPLQGTRQEFRTHATHRGHASSMTIFDRRRRPYFASDISVVQLNATIYSGMSGGPVIGSRGVVGVLSGSYQEGGGLAWAIPLMHMTSLRPVSKGPSEIKAWPPLTLMSPLWDSLRSIIQVNTAASPTYDRLTDATEKLARQYSEANRLAIETRTKFELARPFLQRLVNQGPAAVASDAQVPLKDAVSSFRRFSNVSEALGETWRENAAALAATFAWVTGEAKLDDQTGRALVREMTRVRDEYRDLQPGLEAYLGIDSRKTAMVLPELQSALKDASVAGEAKAWLRLFDAFTPALDAYGSGRALVFMSRDVAKYRRTARLFEPIVYRTAPRR
jgi:hypothetical protein